MAPETELHDRDDWKSPGEPENRTYGPPPDADGNPTSYLYVWDADAGEMVIED